MPMPSRIARRIWASVQLPTPVAACGLMLAGNTLGAMAWFAPPRSLA
jgi:hypothetical protein